MKYDYSLIYAVLCGNYNSLIIFVKKISHSPIHNRVMSLLARGIRNGDTIRVWYPFFQFFVYGGVAKGCGISFCYEDFTNRLRRQGCKIEEFKHQQRDLIKWIEALEKVSITATIFL